jgi:hypothetical protein
MPCTKVALLADALEQIVDLRPAAVHHHRVHADQLEQRHVTRASRYLSLAGSVIALPPY